MLKHISYILCKEILMVAKIYKHIFNGTHNDRVKNNTLDRARARVRNF